MKLKLFTGIAILFFIMQASAFAITGQQVYDKYRQTEKKMEQRIKSMIMVVEMNTSGTITETTVYKKGNKTRVESLIKKSAHPMMGKPGQKSISIDDGMTTTVFHPMMGKMSSPSNEDEDGAETVRRVNYIAKESIEGMACHKIKVFFHSGDKETLWISARDFVLVKEKGDEGTVTVNSDFRKVKGFLMPYRTLTYEDGSLESSSKVKSARVGVKISNSKFDPSKVKGFKPGKKTGQTTQSQEKAGQMMDMMQMAIEIQRLHMNGETEKAEALTKKMQQMTQGQ